MRKYVFVSLDNDYERVSKKARAEKTPRIIVNDPPAFSKNKLKKFFYKLHFTPKINKIIKLPFKSVWKKFILDKSVKKAINNNDEICFIFTGFIDKFVECGFIKYLKEEYKNSKTAYFFGDLVSLYEKNNGLSIDEYKSIFDVVGTYNKIDAQKHGLKLIENSPHDYSFVKEDENIEPCDVLFVGRAKGRLDEIYSIYETLTENGLNCNFYIVGVKEDKQKYADKITFNKFLSYFEYLKLVKRSKAVLNIVQSGADGVTLRDYECIDMNKVLITNLSSIKEAPFFTPEKIILIENLKDELDKIRFKDDSVCWKKDGIVTVEEYLQNLDEIIWSEQ